MRLGSRLRGNDNERMTTALKLEGIHKRFGDFVALQSIDLSIDSGEMVCFLGPSGCGKTTLLRIIAGLERQTSGRITQNGRDVSHAPPAARDYGIVFQSYALFPNLTIDSNVAYGLVNRRKGKGEIRSRVTELLAMVGLPHEGRKYPSQLSVQDGLETAWGSRKLSKRCERRLPVEAS